MESIKKQFNRGYILLESLIALSLLMIVSSVILSQISNSHKQLQKINQEIEELNVTKMALDIGKNQLSGNGVFVRLEEDNQNFKIFDAKGKEKFVLKILESQK